MMQATTQTLQTIKTIQDARLLKDKELRELVSDPNLTHLRTRIALKVDSNGSLDAEPGFQMALNCEPLAKWARLIESDYGKDATINVTPMSDAIQFSIGTSILKLYDQKVFAGAPIEAHAHNGLITLIEAVDRDEMKQARKELAHTRKVEKLERQIVKRCDVLRQSEQAITAHDKQVAEAQATVDAQTYADALQDAKHVHFYRRKLRGLKRMIEHDAPSDLCESGTWAFLGDAQVVSENYRSAECCVVSGSQCTEHHWEAITHVETGRNRYAASFAKYDESRKRVQRMKVKWRMSRAQEKKCDDLAKATRNLIDLAKDLYCRAIEVKHSKELADRVLNRWARTYNEARAILRRADAERQLLISERETAELALSETETELVTLTAETERRA